MQLDWTTFLLEIANFLVLVWILQRFLYDPVRAAITRRQERIEALLGEARAAEAKAEELKSRYENRLKEWGAEREKLRAQLVAELDAERAQPQREPRRGARRRSGSGSACSTRAESRRRQRRSKSARSTKPAGSPLGCSNAWLRQRSRRGSSICSSTISHALRGRPPLPAGRRRREGCEDRGDDRPSAVRRPPRRARRGDARPRRRWGSDRLCREREPASGSLRGARAVGAAREFARRARFLRGGSPWHGLG